MKRFTLISLLALAALAAWGHRCAAADPAGGPDDLLARAKAARSEAEKALAEARASHLEARQALARELAEAYDALDAARKQAAAARTGLERLEAKASDLERTAAAASGKARRHVRQVARAVGAEVEASAPVAEIEAAVRKRLESNLDEIRRHSTVTVEEIPVVTREGNTVTVPVLRVGTFASYACGGDREAQGLLQTEVGDRPLVVGPYLPAAGVAALRAAAEGNLARLPLDITGALAGRAAAEPKDLWAWLQQGGLFIYPIVAVGLLGVLLVLERFGYLVFTKPPPTLLRNVLENLDCGDKEAARQAALKVRIPAGRVLAAGVESVGKSEEQREAAMESALLAEAPHLERSLGLLGALAGVAPLLGLLGTVSGMIATFDTISTVGTGNPRLLSGGISEALITTQLGLMVAIPLLLAHAGLERWVQRREASLEHQAIQVFGIPQNGNGRRNGRSHGGETETEGPP